MNYYDAKWYGNGRAQGEIRPCRGMYMRAEEIDRERKMSGWNQYPGEEETDIPAMRKEDERQGMRENMGRDMRENMERRDARDNMGRQDMRENMEHHNARDNMSHQDTRKSMGCRDKRENMGRRDMRENMEQCVERENRDRKEERPNMWTMPGQNGGMANDTGWEVQRVMPGRQPMPNARPMMPGGQSIPELRPMMPAENMAGMPSMIYETRDAAEILRDQQMAEQDMRRLQSMFPESARMLLPYIEEECDKLEYEGSAMFDERPDQETVRRISESIYGQVQDQFPPQEEQQAEEILSMECRNCGRRGRNWPQDLIHVLLLQEMHQRRCRHGACRRRRW